jgi:predicted RNase H-like HicB family nuclease
MYLFVPRDPTLTPLESLLARRKEWIWIAAEAEKAMKEYDECRGECDDGEYIDIIQCDHNGLSYADHRANLQGAMNTWLATVPHIDTLGEKIEKHMRKQTCA